MASFIAEGKYNFVPVLNKVPTYEDEFPA